ncbi:copper homeostasis protein CutC [Arcticibacter eurypsychrophilus]|uniref:copper homeostasis protein CutC n=1 Tax=Arcticibacter eurypsychrophilus TaxID=1434752 RepID=UPI00084DAFE7|nr:copper homeostasis protein CutC [Arcticibacter eurypsychrophilus]
MQYKLEICANSIESALVAQRGGADRIELCDNMAEGGTTPSAGMIKTCKKVLHIPVFPIIRPRGGGFVYTHEEFEVMKADIQICKDLGCEGVVLGILNTDGGIDKEKCAELISLARPMEVTFHRAFDCALHLEQSLEDIIALGCERVLTSGGAEVADQSLPMIARLVRQADSRIIVMPGSGITEENLILVLKESGATEFHSTAKSLHLFLSHPDHTKIIELNYYQTNFLRVSKMKKILLE